ncbi:hypothetical protein [Enterococcus faecium]|uniref:hypothetical protein n=1 Tax=Enterococcus faecium TaxID=1352 RepID=UPI000939A3D5|nr:hypothetical protein [Enterococcus faecium]PHL10723.1 hypothetical protein CQR41_05105 [Enterococcus faecium]
MIFFIIVFAAIFVNMYRRGRKVIDKEDQGVTFLFSVAIGSIFQATAISLVAIFLTLGYYKITNSYELSMVVTPLAYINSEQDYIVHKDGETDEVDFYTFATLDVDGNTKLYKNIQMNENTDVVIDNKTRRPRLERAVGLIPTTPWTYIISLNRKEATTISYKLIVPEGTVIEMHEQEELDAGGK